MHITSLPFIRTFVQADVTVGTTPVEVLASMPAGGKSVVTIVQNKSTSATIQVILGDSDSGNTSNVGILLQPLTIFSLDNYNGPIQVFASASGTLVHTARGIV